MGNRGTRRFNRCQHRAVEIKNYYKPLARTSNVWNSEPPKSGEYDINFCASLDCPRTRQQGNDVRSHVNTSKNAAFEELATIAAAMVCGTCPISRKSPEQIELDEAARLEARAMRIEAQNRLKAAEQERKRLEKLGQEQVDQINAKFGLDAE